jgi:hypothetical protein
VTRCRSTSGLEEVKEIEQLRLKSHSFSADARIALLAPTKLVLMVKRLRAAFHCVMFAIVLCSPRTLHCMQPFLVRGQCRAGHNEILTMQPGNPCVCNNGQRDGIRNPGFTGDGQTCNTLEPCMFNKIGAPPFITPQASALKLNSIVYLFMLCR